MHAAKAGMSMAQNRWFPFQATFDEEIDRIWISTSAAWQPSRQIQQRATSLMASRI
jgi:hypothetical protein